MEAGAILTLEIEKAVAGGRMLARHQGQVVFVWGAVPGERVNVRIDRIQKRIAYATTLEVLDASPDRRGDAGDWRCGGNVYAHIEYERQRRLKAEILVDALRRIGRVTLAALPGVIGSSVSGYRMRARLHARNGRLGFFREETHELCDACSTGQLLPGTCAWLSDLQQELHARSDDIVGVEIAENVPASERGAYVELRSGEGDTVGATAVTDVLHPSVDSPGSVVRLRRSVRSFFQGNRFLLEPLVQHVLSHVPPGPVVDLYAGVGLFGLSSAARGDRVVAVEGDPTSGADLQWNAESFLDHVTVRREPVERFLLSMPVNVGSEATTFIVDPPRTGMSREAVTNLVLLRPQRVVFVSCDPATLARDLKTFIDAGYALAELTAFDLFPNTAHIEAIAVLTTD